MPSSIPAVAVPAVEVRIPLYAEAPRRAAAHARPSWELLHACTAGGCESSWRTFVERHQRQLSGSVRRLVARLDGSADPALVEDLVQEIYCRLVAGWRRPARRFRGGTDAEATAFLQCVAKSVVLDRRRAGRTRKRAGEAATVTLDFDAARRLPAPRSASPDAELAAVERRRVFRRQCRRLLGSGAGTTALKVAELALFDGLSTREILARSGLSLGTSGVNSVIHRLRRRLARRGVALPRRARRSR